MANNVDILDAAGSTKTVKTTDNTSVHTPHHNIDSCALPTGASTAANQTTIIGHVDGIETLIGTTNSILSTIDGRVDGVETLIGTTNTTLTAIDGHVDGLEASATAIDTNAGATTDAAATAGSTGTIAAKLRAISRDLIANIVLAAGGNIIGKVGIDQTTPGTTNAVSATIAAAQTLATVTTVGTVTTCSTVTTVSTLTGGGVAHDSADSGNPVKIGARCLASPAGATLVADADRTDLVSDKDGATIFRNQTTLGDIKSTAQSVTANTSTAATNFGAVASTKNCITHITVWNSSATAGYVALQDGSGGTAFAYVPCPAGGGATLNFDPPLRQPTANTALYFSASPNASTVYVTINGFQSKI